MCKGRWERIPGYHAKQLVGEEIADVRLSSGNIIKVDACIAPLVQILNDYGITTRYSCCGHGVTSLFIR